MTANGPPAVSAPFGPAPDMVVSIDSVVEKKLAALALMESQFLEGGANGHSGFIPKSPAEGIQRAKEVREEFEKGDLESANRYRLQLKEWYGETKGSQV